LGPTDRAGRLLPVACLARLFLIGEGRARASRRGARAWRRCRLAQAVEAGLISSASRRRMSAARARPASVRRVRWTRSVGWLSDFGKPTFVLARSRASTSWAFGAASVSLAQATGAQPGRPEALDVGVGCGIQASASEPHTPAQVTATDVSRRALRAGPHLAPRPQRPSTGTFARVPCSSPSATSSSTSSWRNPPVFVVSLRSRRPRSYRGRRLSPATSSTAVAWCLGLPARCLRAWGRSRQLLANWVDRPRRGLGRAARALAWTEPEARAWIWQRGRVAGFRPSYARMWLLDGPASFPAPRPWTARYDEWLNWFDGLPARPPWGIGGGWSTFRVGDQGEAGRDRGRGCSAKTSSSPAARRSAAGSSASHGWGARSDESAARLAVWRTRRRCSSW